VCSATAHCNLDLSRANKEGLFTSPQTASPRPTSRRSSQLRSVSASRRGEKGQDRRRERGGVPVSLVLKCLWSRSARRMILRHAPEAGDYRQRDHQPDRRRGCRTTNRSPPMGRNAWDRYQPFAHPCTRRARAIGIRDHPTAPRSPWQNAHVERLIGSIGRECLDHLSVVGEARLRWILKVQASEL